VADSGGSSTHPLVILLTIDALRADVILSRTHDRKLANLAELRDESASFELARSPSPSTLTTVTSLFAGKYYSQLYWTEQGKLAKRDRVRRVIAPSYRSNSINRLEMRLTAA
jgi:hypothetical protein